VILPARPTGSTWSSAVLIVLAFVSPDVALSAQTGASSPLPVAQAAAEGEKAAEWSIASSVYTYFLPDEGNYAQPTVAADAGWFHGEARYNYEALRAGSLWAGVNFGNEGTVTWTITPMFGAVFGDVDGVAPGYKGSLGWRRLELYSEGEAVFDANDSSESFFYNWSELAFLPADWLRLGLVTQRTHAYDAARDIQRGVFAAVSYRRLDAGVYVFNPDDSAPLVVLSVTWTLARP